MNPTLQLPPALRAEVDAALAEATRSGLVRRLWNKEAAVWTGKDEDRWLGWLDLLPAKPADVASYRAIAEQARKDGLKHVLLLGMGGSSLCPEVLAMTFGQRAGWPDLHVLDSTDPGQVKLLESKVDLKRTLVVVSSKSGSTLEPNAFMAYFLDRVRAALGKEEGGKRFVAITDPGSSLEKVAKAEGFRAIVHGQPTVGGRFSALSPFGLLPAALIGVDLDQYLARATAMAQACRTEAVAENPGAALGVVLGALAKERVDKLTIVTSPGVSDLGAWLEQLVGESTGKMGKAIVPVDREAVGAPGVYGDDRLFVHVRLEGAPDPQEAAVAALEAAGKPVVRLRMKDALDLGAELFRWEVATAVAGAVMGVHPFDQPDVEASKIATKRLTAELEKTGSLPAETPVFEEQGVELFADARNAQALGGARTLGAALKAHLARVKPGDYVALLAYVPMTAAHEERLQAARHRIRDAKRVATCLGFGPRFLHSTGQAYKGGPGTGVFLQVTCDDAQDLPVPGMKASFGAVKAAQARGDLEVLFERGRRAVRLHLGKDVAAGLGTLEAAVAEALA